MKNDPAQDLSRWQNRLPSTYETLIKGFHAGMTVDEMTAYLKLDVDVPEKLKKVKIGAFTPDMFADESGADFWSLPIAARNLDSELYNAVNDPDIAAVQMGADFDVDPDNITLETLARVAQTQYLGFQIRMGELTNQNLFNRLEKLRQPDFYEKLRECPYVVKNNLQSLLPKEIPYFEATKKEFSVKSVGSALGKAYERTGKPKKADEFFDNPNKHGVFAITDLQRTSLKLSKSGAIDRETMLETYTDARNVIAIALLSGELGIAIDQDDHCEVSDQVLYPGSAEAKDLLPVFKANGRIYHAGPKGSHIHSRLEIQIQVMEDHLIDQTHKAYEMYRDIKDSLKKDAPSIYGTREERLDMCDNLNHVRITMFNSALPQNIQDVRADFLNNKKFVENDKFALFMNKNDILGTNSQQSVKRAIQVAHDEYPDREDDLQKSVIEFDPFQANKSPALRTTLRSIIQYSDQTPVISMVTGPVVKTYPKNVYNG